MTTLLAGLWTPERSPTPQLCRGGSRGDGSKTGRLRAKSAQCSGNLTCYTVNLTCYTAESIARTH